LRFTVDFLSKGGFAHSVMRFSHNVVGRSASR
jgi:hypothetical protein